MTDNYGRSAETQSGSMMQRGGMGNEERTEKINFMAPKSRWVKQLTIIFGGVLDFWFFRVSLEEFASSGCPTLGLLHGLGWSDATSSFQIWDAIQGFVSQRTWNRGTSNSADQYILGLGTPSISVGYGMPPDQPAHTHHDTSITPCVPRQLLRWMTATYGVIHHALDQ